jgi:hypothetical protein
VVRSARQQSGFKARGQFPQRQRGWVAPRDRPTNDRFGRRRSAPAADHPGRMRARLQTRIGRNDRLRRSSTRGHAEDRLALHAREQDRAARAAARVFADSPARLADRDGRTIKIEPLRSLPSTKKASDRPSGDHVGPIAPSVPRSGIGSVEPRSRTQTRGPASSQSRGPPSASFQQNGPSETAVERVNRARRRLEPGVYTCSCAQRSPVPSPGGMTRTGHSRLQRFASAARAPLQPGTWQADRAGRIFGGISPSATEADMIVRASDRGHSQ